MPVLVPQPGDGPGPLACGCYEPSGQPPPAAGDGCGTVGHVTVTAHKSTMKPLARILASTAARRGLSPHGPSDPRQSRSRVKFDRGNVVRHFFCFGYRASVACKTPWGTMCTELLLFNKTKPCSEGEVDDVQQKLNLEEGG